MGAAGNSGSLVGRAVTWGPDVYSTTARDVSYGTARHGEVIGTSGTTTAYGPPKHVPIAVPDFGDVVDLAIGSRSGLAVTKDGKLWGWGINFNGLLGLGSGDLKYGVTQIGSGTTWSKVWHGSTDVGFTGVMTYALRNDGTLWACGYAPPGLGNPNPITSLTQVGSATNWADVAVSSNGNVMLALRTDGTIWSAGGGQSMSQVGSVTTWTKIAVNAGGGYYGIRSDGTLWSWGAGFNGALGQGNTSSYGSPTQVGTGTDWRDIFGGSSGGVAAVAIKTNGTLWTVGQAAFNGSGSQKNTFSQVGSDTDWAWANVGVDAVTLVKTNGTLWTMTTSTPVQYGSSTNYVKAYSQVNGFYGALRRYAPATAPSSLFVSPSMSPYTWTVPTGVTSVTYDVVAGGGNGGTGYGSDTPTVAISSGGGGGGGECLLNATASVTPGGTISVSVGGQGSSSSFNGVSASPGSNGSNGAAGSTGNGGAGGGTGGGAGGNGTTSTGQNGTSSSSNGGTRYGGGGGAYGSANGGTGYATGGGMPGNGSVQINPPPDSVNNVWQGGPPGGGSYSPGANGGNTGSGNSISNNALPGAGGAGGGYSYTVEYNSVDETTIYYNAAGGTGQPGGVGFVRIRWGDQSY